MTDAPGLNQFTCPRCKVMSHHERRQLLIQTTSSNMTMDVPFSDEAGPFRVDGTLIRLTRSQPENVWEMTLCVACSQASVWRGDVLIYPRESAVPPPHPDMPDAARELYEEARRVLPDSRRAAAALARAALESFLKSQDESGKRMNLQTRIGNLRGLVNEPLWKVLTALRVVGNDSLHGDDDELVTMYLSGEDGGIVEPLFGALNALVEEMITLPRKAEALYSMIPDAKRSAAESAGS
ncbi:DUF4145 domain-containing protein [Microbacterium sp. NPDC077184]|uniref:DUF4145 domain-containing protein n=1 Tax=Microbacterium sp. NPDC077184 TaxID=3154764 RepID=UPI0034201803